MSAPQHPMRVPFDARPLTDPTDKNEVNAFAQHLRASGRAPGGNGRVAAVIVVGVVFAIFMFSSILFSVVIAAISSQFPSLSMVSVMPVLVLLLAGAGVGTAMFIGRGRARERWYRFDRFARANAMTYHPSLKNPPLPGMIFHHGSDRKASDLIRGEHPRFVEFANYRYTTGSGKNQTTHKWGYVAVKLDVPLPHIVLDALGNNGLFGSSNLPASFTRDQRLSLEGDFDRYFALYCPAGYERDALYLFTPDIMARFIDHAAALDVEIVDDWLFLYAKRDFSTLDPATWAWLFSVVRALLDKFDQWARWRDERLRLEHGPDAAHHTPSPELPFAAPAGMLTPPPGVAREGQRLRRGISWGVIVPFVAIAIWVLFQMFSGFGAVLFRAF